MQNRNVEELYCPSVKVLVTTTLVVVLFTTIVLGGGTMPLMKYLEQRMGPSRYSLTSVGDPDPHVFGPED
jgi:hypothetical protein